MPIGDLSDTEDLFGDDIVHPWYAAPGTKVLTEYLYKLQNICEDGNVLQNFRIKKVEEDLAIGSRDID